VQCVYVLENVRPALVCNPWPWEEILRWRGEPIFTAAMSYERISGPMHMGMVGKNAGRPVVDPFALCRMRTR